MYVVLVVDDRPDYFELIKIHLEIELSQPVECLCAHSVAEALQLLVDPSCQEQIDAAIIDILFQDGGDGDELIRALPSGTSYWRLSSFKHDEVDCDLVGCGFYLKSELENLAKSVATKLVEG